MNENITPKPFIDAFTQEGIQNTEEIKEWTHADKDDECHCGDIKCTKNHSWYKPYKKL